MQNKSQDFVYSLVGIANKPQSKEEYLLGQ